MEAASATVEVILYANDGTRKASTGPIVIPAKGKNTWRPSMILGTVTAPVDFEGSIQVTSSISLVGQTNTMYPGMNIYQCDAFDLFESAIPNSTLFFPKAFDNIIGDNHLYDNFVHVQNPDGTARSIKIEQFNNNGTANGLRVVSIGPNGTYVFRPKDFVTDGMGQFRGSVRVTETRSLPVTGAIKFDVHQGVSTAAPVDAMTLYRSMDHTLPHHATLPQPIVKNCSWCHGGLSEHSILGCEKCHAVESLHSIRSGSNGNGFITLGTELPSFGHIGSEKDCFGCHGFLVPAGFDPDTMSNAGKHHRLYGSPIPSMSEAPFATTGVYGCFSCHEMRWNPLTNRWKFQPFRECNTCHLSGISSGL